VSGKIHGLILLIIFLLLFIMTGCAPSEFAFTDQAVAPLSGADVPGVNVPGTDPVVNEPGRRHSVEEGLSDPELLSQYPCGEDGKKVLVCHLPPGNIEALHTICIGVPALAAHRDHPHGMENGYPDILGSCDDAF